VENAAESGIGWTPQSQNEASLGNKLILNN